MGPFNWIVCEVHDKFCFFCFTLQIHIYQILVYGVYVQQLAMFVIKPLSKS